MKIKEIKLKGLTSKILNKQNTQRFFEIDTLRGLAIILMIFGHILWDLDYFKIMPMNNALYSILSKTVPQLFFLLVGISLIVSKKRIESKTLEEENNFYKRTFVRGLKIFGLGMALTIGSLIFIPDKPVFFGVLHCIGLSIILTIPVLKYKNYAFLFAMFFIFVNLIITQYPVENPNAIQLVIGIHQTDIMRHTVDYFPLLPWFAIILLGIAIGDWLYCGDKRVFRIPDLSKYKPVKIFQWAGQHSLGIYLIHQPVIAGVLMLFLMI